MAIAFPISPIINQTYTFGGLTYQWTGSAWQVTTELDSSNVTHEETTVENELNQLDSSIANLSVFPSGTILLFQQTTAPTGWTKITTHNNKALRVVSGTASSGGSVGFTTAFASKTITGNTGSTTLTSSSAASHNHIQGTTYIETWTSSRYGGDTNTGRDMTTAGSGNKLSDSYAKTSTIGSSNSHTHTMSSGTIDLRVQYVDLIFASKDVG